LKKGFFNYVDTFNRVWFAEELCSEQDAIELVNEYYDNLAASFENCKSELQVKITVE